MATFFLFILILQFYQNEADWWEDRFNGEVSNENVHNNNNGGWVRICMENGDRFETFASSCPMGVFLKTPIVPGCVCMQGLWILHPTLCDHSPYIFFGESIHNQCYQIDFDISMFIYLGDPNDISKSKVYVAPHPLTVFREITQDDETTPKLNFYWQSIISINPTKPVEAQGAMKKYPICYTRREFVPKNKQNVIKAHIWDSALKNPYYKLVDSCEGKTLGGYDNLIGTGKDFFYRSNKKVPVPITPCSPQCKNFIQSSKSEKSKDKNSTEIPMEDQMISRDKPTPTPMAVEKLNDDDKVDKSVAPPLLASTPSPSDSGNEKTILERKKRYKAKDTVSTTWDGLAFCMTSYWDPLLKYEMATPEEKRCYPENLGVVEDDSKNKFSK